jgi:hypothetical protein
MNSRLFILFVLVFVFQHLNGQLSKFQTSEKITDRYIIYEYRKSNWDGTHSSSIFLYIADSNRLESFKTREGGETATLVTAIIDLEKFSIKQFQNHRLQKGKEPMLIATLKMTGEKTIKIEVGDMRDSLVLTDLPWQSYDFDFAGLGFTWRALKDKKDSFWFHIADAALVNGNMAFVNKGKVEVKFAGYETVNNKSCLKYIVDGAGLENKGGSIWINPESFMIEQYKIALPDEPGFENGMLQLVRTEMMHPLDWEKFKKRKLGE